MDQNIQPDWMREPTRPIGDQQSHDKFALNIRKKHDSLHSVKAALVGLSVGALVTIFVVYVYWPSPTILEADLQIAAEILPDVRSDVIVPIRATDDTILSEKILFSSDGSKVAVWMAGIAENVHTINFCDLDAQRAAGFLRWKSHFGGTVAMSPDGALVIYDTKPGVFSAVAPPGLDRVFENWDALGLDPELNFRNTRFCLIDKDHLATVVCNKRMHVWEHAEKKKILTLELERSRLGERSSSVAFRRDGSLVALFNGENGLDFVNPRTGKVLGRTAPLDKECRAIHDVVFSTDGKKLACMALKGENLREGWIYSWSVPEGKLLGRWVPAPPPFLMSFLGPDHILLSTIATKRVHESATGKVVCEFFLSAANEAPDTRLGFVTQTSNNDRFLCRVENPLKHLAKQALKDPPKLLFKADGAYFFK